MHDTDPPAPQSGTLPRRQALVGVALALGGMALASTKARAQIEEAIGRTGESIHQEAFFQANRTRVYAALTDTKQFNQVTLLSAAVQSGMALPTAPTEIGAEVGSAFALFGGYVVGRQIELVPGARIVQAWRVVRWHPGVYSIVRFELDDQGSGTRLILDHTGFPKGDGEHLAAGWKANYWEPLGKFLA
jgi:activator of HSP90 ATPase